MRFLSCVSSCKPQMAESILSEQGMREALDGKLVISILAGLTIASLRAMVPESTRVVRAMPNTPCKVSLLVQISLKVALISCAYKIREGMTVCTTVPSSAPSATKTRQILLSLFQPIGKCRFLDEKHFDATTAVCGSGPAFAMLFLEAMADGGVMMGLPRAEALELAAQS